MKRRLSTLLTVIVTLTGITAFTGNTPPAKPDGKNVPTVMGEMGTPPDGLDGNGMNQPLQDGTPMGTPPGGFGGNGMGQPPQSDAPMGMAPDCVGSPGGQSSKPDSYTAVSTYAEDCEIRQESTISNGTDENAILVIDGAVNVSDSILTRNSANSTGGDSASFYGVGAAVLTTGGTVELEHCVIEQTLRVVPVCLPTAMA